MLKKNLLAAIVAFITIAPNSVSAQVEQVQETGAGISRRLQHEIDMTKDPALGIVPAYRLVNAYEQKKTRMAQLANRAPLFTWTERGPNSDAVGPSNGNSRPGNGITSGRMRAIWEDLSDATGKTVWVGGIDGGIWKTNDITATPATWTLSNDFLGNLAVASICQDPTDNNIMYFGTGEKAINSDAVRGAGIWMTTDHGITWSLMPNTQNYWNVSKVVCDASGNLYVGCNSISNTQGLQRYTKSSDTWTNITPGGLDPRVPDFELSTTGRLHVVCGYYNTAATNAGYRYTDTPATVISAGWTSPATTFPTQYNVALASNGNTLFALPSTSAFEVTTIYKSTNGGANWAATGTTPSFTSGQSWYNMAVAIDPANANNVIVGALDCYKSTNGGTSWSKISEWVGTTGQYVHADQQIIRWRNNNQVLVGSDGGIHYSGNGGTTFQDKNTGLRLKQFYSVAIHPSSTNYFLAGAQDNGNHQLNSAGLGASVEVTGGDGAFVHIDQDQPQYQWGAYVYNQYRRSTNSGAGWTSVNYSSSAGQFINPTDYDDINNIMYASGNANTFVRWSNPQSGSTFTAVTMSGLNSGKVTSLKVSPYTNHTVYFAGGGSGITPSLIKATNANGTPTFTSFIGTGMTTIGARISCIELGTDEQNIIAVYSNYGVNNVWVTTNGGTSWTAIDGNLPDMPVRWAMFYPGSNNTKAIIATETGVWQTELINGAATVWDPETGFPNVRVDMLQYRASDGLLAAATHGRGLFTTIIGAAPSCGTVSGLASSAVTANSATISWTALSGALNYDVDYKLNSTSTWTNAATATTNTAVNLSALTISSLYDWRVRANCTGATGAYVQAQFTTTAACGTPTGLTTSAITNTSASISWTAVSSALSYDVDYKTAATSTWTNAATGTTATSANLTLLTQGTAYDWRVRANCTAGAGNYTQTSFITTAPCNDPTGLTSAAITSSSATVSWAAISGATNYTVDYKLNSTSIWSSAISATTSTAVNITGLASASLYDWRVRTNCTSGSSAFVQAQFTTAAAPSCPGALDVSTNGNRTGAATIPFNTDTYGLINPTGDVDYYRFVITTGGTLTVTLNNLPADYDLRLYRNATNVASSSNSGTTNETISYTATANTYYARVIGFNGAFNASNCYTLRVQLGTATTVEVPVELVSADKPKLVLFPNPANDRLTVYVAGYDKQKVIEIFNVNGQRVFAGKQADNSAILDISKLAKGLYMMKVSGVDGSLISQEKFIKQ
jgi:Secretion system C-terminal sorting domain/Bacterial pre-peptidase C-terminal domain/Fibronectin type III domain